MLAKAVPDEKLCEIIYFPTFRCFIVLQCSSIKTGHLSIFDLRYVTEKRGNRGA